MRRILLYFILCSMALASSEILYTKDRIVVVNNKVTTHEHKGRYFYKADIYFVWQRDFWQDIFLKNWLTGYVPMTLHDFREFALVYNPWPPPWVLANITKEQWLDWEKTGQLHAVEYLESQARNAVIKAAAVDLYIDPDGSEVFTLNGTDMGAGEQYRCESDAYGSLMVECLVAGKWTIKNVIGTWVEQTP